LLDADLAAAKRSPIELPDDVVDTLHALGGTIIGGHDGAKSTLASRTRSRDVAAALSLLLAPFGWKQGSTSLSDEEAYNSYVAMRELIPCVKAVLKAEPGSVDDRILAALAWHIAAVDPSISHALI